MSKTIGLILSGSGVKDGSEIHEATLALLGLVKRGANIVFMAPSGNQSRVMNHATMEEVDETRSMLVEGARIARGEIVPISDVDPSTLDGLMIPGGFGAALNLSTFGTKGRDMTVHSDVEGIINKLLDASKPIAALCIAPPILARVFQNRGGKGVKLTIGNDPATAAELEAMGAVHVESTASEFVVDESHKVVTTCAYMLASDIAELNIGIDKACQALMELA